MEPVNISNPDLWSKLGQIFGPGGVALLIGFAASLYGLKLFWERLKQKDEECRAEMDKAEARWETRFQQMRSDVKEGFSTVASLTQQVALIATKIGGTKTP